MSKKGGGVGVGVGGGPDRTVDKLWRNTRVKSSQICCVSARGCSTSRRLRLLSFLRFAPDTDCGESRFFTVYDTQRWSREGEWAGGERGRQWGPEQVAEGPVRLGGSRSGLRPWHGRVPAS